MFVYDFITYKTTRYKSSISVSVNIMNECLAQMCLMFLLFNSQCSDQYQYKLSCSSELSIHKKN